MLFTVIHVLNNILLFFCIHLVEEPNKFCIPLEWQKLQKDDDGHADNKSYSNQKIASNLNNANFGLYL